LRVQPRTGVTIEHPERGAALTRTHQTRLLHHRFAYGQARGQRGEASCLAAAAKGFNLNDGSHLPAVPQINKGDKSVCPLSRTAKQIFGIGVDSEGLQGARDPHPQTIGGES